MKWLPKYNALPYSPLQIGQIIGLAVIYFAASKFGFSLAVVAEQVTVIWPPTGIALAAILLFGTRMWPGIALGAFLANITTNEPLLTALGITLGNTLEAVAGAWMLQRYAGTGNYLGRIKGIQGLVLFCAGIGTMISATIGTTSLCLGGVQPWSVYSTLWLTWWLGDAGGALIIAPLLLAWYRDPYSLPSPRTIIEAAVLMATAAASYVLIFITPVFLGTLRTYPYMIFPVVIWTALRFGPRAVTLMTLVISAITVWATAHQTGPFSDMHLTQALTILQTFTLIVAITGLTINAAIHERREAEKQIHEDWQRTQHTLAFALDAVIGINQEGLVDRWNKQAEVIFGWTADEAVGKPLVELIIPSSYREAHLRGMNRFLTLGVSNILNQRVELTALNKQGGSFPVELTVSAQKLHDRFYFTAFLRDISDRKRAEESTGFLASLVLSSDDTIIGETLDGIVSTWNAGAERLFGYVPAEIIGRPITTLIPPDKQEEESQILARLQKGQRSEHVETVRITKDGRRINVLLTVSPIYNSKKQIVGASKIIHDITQRKEAEKTLLRYTRDLKRSNQELDDFAYIASHDLKEPLRGLLTQTSFLLEDYQEKLDAEGIRRLRRVMFLSQRMEMLINDLLYFSRLGRTELAVQEVDPNEVVGEIRQMMETFLKERNARITIPEPMPRIVCDKLKITEVFRNLITNAVKYNDKTERIVEVGHLDKAKAPHGEETNVFYVKDNGVGIEPEFHEAIFRIFKRLQNPAIKNGEGTGAGLTFVKKIIDRHKGHIWLDSEPGKGSTFYFTLGSKDS